MTIDRMIELLKIEHECVLRNTHGDCDRQCDGCDLVQDDGELHEMYTDVEALLKAQQLVTCRECQHYDPNPYDGYDGKCRNSESCHYCYGCLNTFGCNAGERR